MATRVTAPQRVAKAASQEGRSTKKTPGKPKAKSLISDAKLRELYTTMLQARLLDERARVLHRQNQLPGRYLSFLGLETAVVGTAIDLRREDWMVPPPQEALGSFVKGAPLSAIFAAIAADGAVAEPSLPSSRALASSLATDRAALKIAPPALTVAVQIGVAAGVALAGQAKKGGSVVVAFAGQGRSTGGAWEEALRFAGAHRLPLIVVRQAFPPLPPPKRGKGVAAASPHVYGVPVIAVDRDDVVAIYRVACESIHKARHGGGPTLIEAMHWKLNASARGKTAKPPQKGTTDAKATDSIARMEAYLTAKGLFSSKWKQRVIDRFKLQLEAAVEAAATTARSKSEA